VSDGVGTKKGKQRSVSGGSKTTVSSSSPSYQINSRGSVSENVRDRANKQEERSRERESKVKSKQALALLIKKGSQCAWGRRSEKGGGWRGSA